MKIAIIQQSSQHRLSKDFQNLLLCNFSCQIFPSKEDYLFLKEMRAFSFDLIAHADPHWAPSSVQLLFLGGKTLVKIPGTLPFTVEDLGCLVAAVQNLEKCASQPQHSQHRYLDIQLSNDPYSLKIDGDDTWTPLTRKEYLILKELVKHAPEPVDRATLTEQIWSEVSVGRRSIDSYISKIRKYLETSELNIKSIYGKGYNLLPRSMD